MWRSVPHQVTTGQGTDDHHAEDHASRHAAGGADPLDLGDLLYSRTAISTTTTISTPRQIVGCTAHTITVTLASAMLAAGQWVAVKDESGGAGGVDQAITVDTEGAETIDGSSSLLLDANYEGVLLYSDGTNWFTLSSIGTIL